MSKTPKDFVPKRPKPGMWEEAPLTNKQKSVKHEARLAKKIGFTPTINSGSLPSVWQKEDGYQKEYVYQLKRTEGKDARIVSLEVLELVTSRAYAQNKDPVVVLTFAKASTPTPRDWVMIPEYLWTEVISGEDKRSL